MRHKSVRLFTVLICCLAIPVVASAAQDNNKKKKQGQQNQQAQHQGQPGGKHQNAGNQNMMNKGNKGFNNPNKSENATMSNQGNKWNKGNQGGNKAHNAKNPNMAHQGNQWNKGNKGKQSFNNPKKPNNQNIANQGNKGLNNPNLANKNKNLPNNPNKVAGGQANKAKWQTKHYDNIAKGPNKNIKSVTFQNNYKIKGAANWQGAHYAAFRDYHAEWHDHAWWHNHYGRNLVLIGGGWYFLNPLGFWAPAWGYNPAQAYYPYNGPIYAYRNLPLDQVIANVQANLQDQGYYTGEVDGLLGPLTQEALVNFQNANDLAPTGSIDEPTLDALGMS
jgi:Putative peptidoglycan binding domain